MFNFLFSSDPRQTLRMYRHLAALSASLIFTGVSVYFFNNNLYSIEQATFYAIIIFFWVGGFIFTAVIRSGLNERFADPSLTAPQILWCTLFILTITYLLNEWRGLMLMAYFGVLSFGYFKFRLQELLSVALFAIFGYAFIIGYLFINEPDRIDIKLEFLQWMIFSLTISVMLYTGSAIHQLRTNSKKHYLELQDALELNKKLTITDELTGLYNRRYLIDKLAYQMAVSERDGSDFVICSCDLDQFKSINDNFGHHVGDAVLQRFGKLLKSSLRQIDYVARFGGDEFVCLLVNADTSTALKITERIRKTLASYNFSDIEPSLHLTVSIGIANFRQFNSIQDTLISADNRMYRAKALGNNKVVSSDDDNDEEAA